MEAKEDAEGGFTASDRYFCPFPGCKRSFAELWRLKVHYRAPPDVRGSGKERGHGTELTHCPKCGKGLKPGKHHVGCSGGKTAPRQAKRSRVATPTAGTLIPPDGMNGDMQGMYGAGMMMQGSYGPGMQGAAMPNGYSQPGYGQQYPAYAQQYQPDASGSYYQGQTQHMGGGVMQPQVQQQQQPGSMQSPTLGMGMMQDTNATSSGGGMLVHAGSGEMLAPNNQGYMYQQPQQQQALMPPMMQMPQQPQQLPQQPQQPELLQPHMQPSMDVMGAQQQQQQPQQQQLLMPHQQVPQVKQEAPAVVAQAGTMTASGAFLAQQQLQQQQSQQQQAMMGQGQEQGYMPHDAAAAAAGLMPPPPPVAQLQQQQLQMQQSSSSMMPPPPPPPPHNQISSTLFDEIDNMSAGGAVGSADAAAGLGPGRAPSPPPLPADFPSAVGAGTLFNFAQFNQKLPAAGGPSQQMAMMPRGMEQELPPSMDDLWTPEATYDHHSDGDLMQLLFGAPEQPPTMATIHLHHFLEDDACSSPLLTGLLGSSMDDLRAAEAKATTNTLTAGNATAVSDAAAVAADDGNPGVKVQLQQQPQQQGLHGGMMLPPAAVAMPGQQQQEGNQQPHQLHSAAAGQHHMQQQHQMQPCQVLQQQHSGAPLNGTNGMIAGQCGAAAVQVQMQLQVRMHGDAAAAGMVQIKAEDGNCLLQKAAVASLTEAVVSRAT